MEVIYLGHAPGIGAYGVRAGGDVVYRGTLSECHDFIARAVLNAGRSATWIEGCAL